jgi:hypothetical protein
MMEQVRLLMGGDVEFASDPFMLGPKACLWDNLKVGVKSKTHEWRELPGGALAAFKRVHDGPQGFKTPLMQACGEGWSFKNTVSSEWRRFTVVRVDAVTRFSCLMC